MEPEAFYEAMNADEEDYGRWKEDIYRFAEAVDAYVEEVDRHREGSVNAHTVNERYRRVEELSDAIEPSVTKIIGYSMIQDGITDTAEESVKPNRPTVEDQDPEGVKAARTAQMIELNPELEKYFNSWINFAEQENYVNEQLEIGMNQRDGEGEPRRIEDLESRDKQGIGALARFLDNNQEN